jgi:alpha-mannosidase
LHQFSYALYPHPGSWQTAQTPRRGYELNRPLQAFLYDPPEAVTARQLPPVSQFLNLQANNLILMAVKQAEDEPEQWILRCYECCGETAQLDLQNHLNLVVHQRVDLLERPTSCKEINSIEPWTIGSFLLS